MDENKVHTVYMRRDTRLTQYLPYPQYLLTLDISGTAKVLYALLLNRATLSQKNAWADDAGRIYIIYPIDAMAGDLHKSRTTVKHALAELDGCGLLERRPSGFGRPNHLYIKIPEGSDSGGLLGGEVSAKGSANRPYDGQNPASDKAGKSPPNYYKNNKIQNNWNGAMETRTPHGRYKNIFLSESEYEALRRDYPDTLQRFIEELSNYLSATGKSYANYEAGIRMWASNDKKTSAQHRDHEDYSYTEGESY